MKKIIIPILALFVIMLGTNLQMQAAKLSHSMTGPTYNEAIKSNKKMLVMFYVDWCGYCKRISPTIAKLSQEYKDTYNFVYVNDDNPQNHKLSYEYKINSYPTIYLVNPETGKKVKLHYSRYNEAALKKELDAFLK